MIGRIRLKQMVLAEELSGQLFDELKHYVDNGKIGDLEDYVRDLHNENINYNQETAEVMLKIDLLRGVFASIKGYTDWALCKIVRSIDYSVPSPKEIDFTAIKEKYNAPLETLKRAVNFMHSRESLPLLGKIEEGDFCPDREELEEWKSFYSWDDQ